jgi:hypothetical protein
MLALQILFMFELNMNSLSTHTSRSELHDVFRFTYICTVHNTPRPPVANSVTLITYRCRVYKLYVNKSQTFIFKLVPKTRYLCINTRIRIPEKKITTIPVLGTPGSRQCEHRVCPVPATAQHLPAARLRRQLGNTDRETRAGDKTGPGDRRDEAQCGALCPCPSPDNSVITLLCVRQAVYISGVGILMQKRYTRWAEIKLSLDSTRRRWKNNTGIDVKHYDVGVCMDLGA